MLLSRPHTLGIVTVSINCLWYWVLAQWLWLAGPTYQSRFRHTITGGTLVVLTNIPRRLSLIPDSYSWWDAGGSGVKGSTSAAEAGGGGEYSSIEILMYCAQASV